MSQRSDYLGTCYGGIHRWQALGGIWICAGCGVGGGSGTAPLVQAIVCTPVVIQAPALVVDPKISKGLCLCCGDYNLLTGDAVCQACESGIPTEGWEDWCAWEVLERS